MNTKISFPIAIASALALSLPTFAETMQSPTASTGGNGPTTASRSMNPDIGANLLGLYLRSPQQLASAAGFAHRKEGLSFQEGEFTFTSDVDVYLRANIILSVSQNEKGEYGIDPEEAYFETTTLPFVTVRAGKFYAAMGRHNQLHTHAFPFIDAPLTNQRLFGGEGFNDVGVSASALLPSPWFTELTVQAFDAHNPQLFAAEEWKLGPVAQLRNLWDLSESSTIELNLFGTRGPNAYASNTTAYGGDFIVKWRPTEGGKYHAVVWQTQYLNGLVSGLGDASERRAGVASWIQYQFAERWWAEIRGDIDGLHRLESYPLTRRASALIGFFPSEFSGFRAQYDRVSSTAYDKGENVFALQYNISIGAHPAHAY